MIDADLCILNVWLDTYVTWLSYTYRIFVGSSENINQYFTSLPKKIIFILWPNNTVIQQYVLGVVIFIK